MIHTGRAANAQRALQHEKPQDLLTGIRARLAAHTHIRETCNRSRDGGVLYIACFARPIVACNGGGRRWWRQWRRRAFRIHDGVDSAAAHRNVQKPARGHFSRAEGRQPLCLGGADCRIIGHALVRLDLLLARSAHLLRGIGSGVPVPLILDAAGAALPFSPQRGRLLQSRAQISGGFSQQPSGNALCYGDVAPEQYVRARGQKAVAAGFLISLLFHTSFRYAEDGVIVCDAYLDAARGSRAA